MDDPTKYPAVDPYLRDVIRQIDRDDFDQAQYATLDQLLYLIDFAHKYGLYDAADWIRKGLDNRLV